MSRAAAAAAIEPGRARRRRGGDRQFRRRAPRPPRRDRRRARPRRSACSRKAAALTFAPHPRAVLPPAGTAVRAFRRARQAAPAGGDRARRRLRHDLRCGARRHPAEDFIERILVGRLGVERGGDRLRFPFRQEPHRLAGLSGGAGRAARLCGRHRAAAGGRGPAGLLRRGAQGARPGQGGGGGRASGRALVRDGARSSTATSAGAQLGFPTANLRLDPACGLKHGIYAVRVGVGGQALRRRGELRPPPDVRRRRAAAGGLSVRLRRRPLRADDRRRLHRLDPPRAEVRRGSRRSSAP